MKNKLRQFFVGVLVACVTGLSALGYVYSTHQSVWTPGGIPMQIKLGGSTLLSDGTSYSTSLQAAMQTWNQHLGTVQFVPQIVPASTTQADHVNDVYFSNTIEGDAFGSGVLAVTLVYLSPSVYEIVEADIIFNTAWTWDSYRGNMRAAEDIRRVALHELGHVLGLTHPDEHGQNTSSLMNSTISDLDGLTADDIAGAQSIYRAPGQVYAPVNDDFSTAIPIIPEPPYSWIHSGSVTGTNIYATKEAGEPSHDPDGGGLQGASVWWKWTTGYSGRMTVTTQGSKFDTVLGVYTGSVVSALTLIGNNDDVQSGAIRYSSVTFNVVSGVTYYFAVDGWEAATGPIRLNLDFDVMTAPSIGRQPSSMTVEAGASAVFEVRASGEPSPSYQWQRLPAGGGNWTNLVSGGGYGSTTLDTLYVNAALAMDGDQFRCLVSNSSGTLASEPAVLTVLAQKPPRFVRDLDGSYAAQLGGSVEMAVSVGGVGPFSYQWYHAGVPIAGAISSTLVIDNVGGMDAGEYFVAITNAAGVTISRIAFLQIGLSSRGPFAPLDYHWVKAIEAEGVVYFLFKSPARIARYDLAAEAWLTPWVLDQTPADFAITADAIYLANGNNVNRYDRGLNSSSILVADTKPVTAVLVIDNYLVTIGTSSQATSLASYDRQTGQGVAATVISRGLDSGHSYSPQTRRIYGRRTSSSSHDIESIIIQADGSFSGYMKSVYHSEFPRAEKTFVLAASGEVMDSSGVVYDAATLKYTSSFGDAISDIMPREESGYYILRAGRISSTDQKHRETGAAYTTIDGTRFWLKNGNFFVFAQPAFAGSDPALEKVATGLIQPAVLAPLLNPSGLKMWSPQLVMDTNGVVYLYSRLYRNIFRWSPRTGDYLASLPLANNPSFLAYSARSQALIFEERGFQIKSLPLQEAGGTAQPLLTVPLVPTGLQSADDYLMVAYDAVQSTGELHATYDPHGRPITFGHGYYSREYTWSSVNRLMYSYNDGSSSDTLRSWSIDGGGRIVHGLTSPEPDIEKDIPVRVSPDGSTVVVGSGLRYDGLSLAETGRFSVSPVDVAWAGGVVHTIVASGLSTRIDSWSTATYQTQRSAMFTGMPVRLFTLPGDYLLLVTTNAGELSYRILEPASLSTVSDYNPVIAPTIIGQPANVSALVGGNATFHVRASGWPAPAYQWQRLATGGQWSDLVDNENYAGTGSATLMIMAGVTMQGAQFRCVISNESGTIISDVVTLTVAIPLPVIVTQPQDMAMNVGNAVGFSVTAASPVVMNYQWQKDGADIGGATDATYSIGNFQAGDVGNYQVVVTNSAGSVISDVATLAVAVAPTIMTQPAGRTVYAGESVTFTVVAASNATPRYEWRKNGAAIPGATQSSYTLSPAQLEHAGDYSVVVTNVAGSITSSAATLVVNPSTAPVLTQQPVSRTALLGAMIGFEVAATGVPAPVFRWQRSANGTGPWTDLSESGAQIYTGVMQANLLLLAGATQMANNADRFRCVASNVAGSATSEEAVLTVSPAGAIIQAAAGNNHSAFIRIDGSVWGTGRNQEGQLGDGTGVSHLSPVRGAGNVVGLASGSEHTLFLKGDGSLWTAGYNEFGALGTVSAANAGLPVQIAAGVAAVAGGHRHSLFRKNDGTLWAMGWNANGQLGDGTTINRPTPVQVAAHVVEMAAGYDRSLFIKSDGTLWATGANGYGQFGDGTATSTSAPVQVGANMTAVASGFYHSLRLKTDGTLWASGHNGYGQLGDGSHGQRLTPVQVASGVKAVAVGAVHSVYLKTDGTLWGMGDNSRGQLGDGSGGVRTMPVQIASAVTGMSAGLYFTQFVKTDGSLWACGANDQGQIGDGTTTDRTAPVQIASGGASLPHTAGQPMATISDTADRIQLSWGLSIGSNHYEVWRGTSVDRAGATPLTMGVVGSYYEDLTATTGVNYFYWIVATNVFGKRTEGGYAQGRAGVPVAAIAPTISMHPQSQTVNVGDSVTFSVVADGTMPLTYQWRKDTEDLVGANVASYTIDGAEVTDVGSYDVVVANTAGSATSNPAILMVNKLSQTVTFAALDDRGYTATPISLSAIASSGLTVAFSVQAGPATIVGDQLTLTGLGTVTVRASQAGDETYAAATPVDRSFVVTGNYGAWLSDHFTYGELGEPTISGPNAVYGQDGLPNLVKYALGLDPKVNATNGLPEVTATESNWVYTYTRPSSVTDVTYQVEVSTDLITWTTEGVVHSRTDEGLTETWQATYPVSLAANLYFRLKITESE